MESKKSEFEVTVSIRLHGVFTVEAWNRREAEDAISERLRKGEIDLNDLELADEARIDCVTDGGEEDEACGGFFCPLRQCDCDQECSWAEKANCDYYQGLMATK